MTALRLHDTVTLAEEVEHLIARHGRLATLAALLVRLPRMGSRRRTLPDRALHDLSGHLQRDIGLLR